VSAQQIAPEERIRTVCLLLIATVVVGAALYWLRPVLIPFVLSMFLALALSPLVDFQVNRLKMPRGFAVFGAFVLALVILSLLGYLITTSAVKVAANAGEYQAQFTLMVQRIAETLPLDRLGINLDSVMNIPIGAVGSMLVTTTNALVNIVSNGTLVAIFVVFMLIGGGTAATRPTGTWSEVEAQTKRYIVYKALLSAFTGIAVGGVLSFLGVDLAMVFGLFAFLLNFIPSIGSIIATLLPVPVVLMSPNLSLTAAILAIAIPGAIQFTVGNVIEPKIMGDELDLHPVTILLTLIIWGMLWGIVGMLLATPITAVMKILFSKNEITAPIADIMAGRLDRLRDA
jgi:AI-2 transport protein TqsA